MAKLNPMGEIDSRKELERYLREIPDKAASEHLRRMILEYALQREIEILEEAKELVDGASQEWIDLEGLSHSVLVSGLPDKL